MLRLSKHLYRTVAKPFNEAKRCFDKRSMTGVSLLLYHFPSSIAVADRSSTKQAAPFSLRT